MFGADQGACRQRTHVAEKCKKIAIPPAFRAQSNLQTNRLVVCCGWCRDCVVMQVGRCTPTRSDNEIHNVAMSCLQSSDVQAIASHEARRSRRVVPTNRGANVAHLLLRDPTATLANEETAPIALEQVSNLRTAVACREVTSTLASWSPIPRWLRLPWLCIVHDILSHPWLASGEQPLKELPSAHEPHGTWMASMKNPRCAPCCNQSQHNYTTTHHHRRVLK